MGRIAIRCLLSLCVVTATPEVALGNIWSTLFGGGRPAIYDSMPGEVQKHPAVVRIVVQENGAMAFGSGTLVGVNELHGLVVTNWHVVRDAAGPVEVIFPAGFRTHARPLKVDSDWDLAALVIWRPDGVEPVKISRRPPRPGDLLTIHGYGRGKYRIATGRCTTYYSPQPNFPHEMVELDVEARQGDSGGPIFNQNGELAGVLFGAGQGTTMGSFAPRVRHFLSQVAPDLDRVEPQPASGENGLATNVVAVAAYPEIDRSQPYPCTPWSANPELAGCSTSPLPREAVPCREVPAENPEQAGNRVSVNKPESGGLGWLESAKTILAAIGVLAITLRLLKFVG